MKSEKRPTDQTELLDRLFFQSQTSVPYSGRLVDFIRESNRIEGIRREPTDEEIAAHRKFLSAPIIGISELIEFVSAVQPGAVLRDREGLNVRVGRHYPPPGGRDIPEKLANILGRANSSIIDWQDVFNVHRSYLNLHPFTDCNGRSSRVLWLRMMDDGAPLGFLHTWYYQSLDAGDRSS